MVPTRGDRDAHGRRPFVALGHDVAVGWCILPSGDEWPWLFRRGGYLVDDGCACQHCAPHEQPGRLPAVWQARVEAAGP